MGDYGIKVSKASTSISDGDIRDLIMSSKYNILKYHSDTDVSVTFSPGDIEKTVDVTHGLGYVPAYLVYYRDDNGYYYLLDGLPTGIGYMDSYYAYADSTKIRCGANLGYAYNQIKKYAWTWAYSNDGGAYALIGNNSGAGEAIMRYNDIEETDFEFGTLVTLPQGANVSSATLDFYIQEKGTSTSNVKIKTYGIDEDNTTVTYDWGLARTDAVTTQEVAASTIGDRFGINVTSQVQEIVNRANWASGNNMAFYILNNGSDSDAWRKDAFATPDTYLTIQKSGTMTMHFRVIIFKDRIA